MGWVALFLLAAPSIDFDAVPRRIARPPKLVAKQARYALYLFGPAGQKRVWAILDKSTPDAKAYDVLYLDLDADGDLTEPGERFTARKTVRYERGHASIFRIEKLKDPATGAVHTKFELRSLPDHVRCTINWRGTTHVRSMHRLRFADSVATAPVFVPGHDRPMEFRRNAPQPLRRGRTQEVYFALGNAGSSEAAFFCVDNNLLAKDEPIALTLSYVSRSGTRKRHQVKLRERC